MSAVDSEKRFIGLCLPTGSGKTLIYMITALLTGARVCALTSTKALQDQLLEDFANSGLVDVRGQGNYPCKELIPGGRFWRSDVDQWRTNCDNGPCHSGYPCSLKVSGCHHFDAHKKALDSRLVSTNYSYWMAVHKYRDGLGKFDLLVLDEAHLAFNELATFLHVDLNKVEIEGLLGSRMLKTDDQKEWSGWAGSYIGVVDNAIEGLREQQKAAFSSEADQEMRALKRVLNKLKAIHSIKGKWVIERVGGKVTFDPVWPAPYAEDNLFLGSSKVMLVSATLRKKTCELLGVDLKDLEFLEQPSTFPVERRPLIHVPAIQVSFKSTDVELRHWVRRIDDLINDRLDRKGIIPTVSFDRRTFLKQHSLYKDIMLANVTSNTGSVIERFKRAAPPRVLVSPSISTGHNFPDDTCRYIIIVKIPFPDNRSKILQARSKEMEDYIPFLAMQSLVQTCGRGDRSKEDWCEILCVDDNILWFIWKYRDFAPKSGFLDAFRKWDSLTSVPRPLNINT